MNYAKYIVFFCLSLALMACGKGRSGLADAIDPETGSFQKYRTWKAENGKMEIYGVDLRYIQVFKSKTSEKIDTAAMDTESTAKLSAIQNATAQLCHTSTSQLQNIENNVVYFGEVKNQIGGDTIQCSYMKRYSDGIGSITMARNPTN
jgi:hypothetical protein